MITTAFAHGVARVALTRARDHLDVELFMPDRELRVGSLTVFGDSLIRTRPALTVDGVDPAELLASIAAINGDELPNISNESMDWGNRLEPTILTEAAHRLGCHQLEINHEKPYFALPILSRITLFNFVKFSLANSKSA